MLRPLLIGVVAGARALTPLAAISLAARSGRLARGGGASRWLASPAAVAGSVALALAEAAGDKLPSAPDRTTAPGLGARLVSGALAGAVVAPRGDRVRAAALGAGAAVASAFVTHALRLRALRRFGTARSGVAEDALAIGGAAATFAVRPG